MRDTVDRRIDIVARCALALFLATVVMVAIIRPWLRGDSRRVVVGADGILHCIADHRFTHCDRLPNGVETGAGPTGFVYGNVAEYPPLQYIPAVALEPLGVSHALTLRLLIIADAVALAGIVLIVWRTASRVCAPVWPPLLAAVIIASPLLWYGISAFGEVLAGFVIVAAIAAVALNARASVIIALVAVACLSKETNPPFVFALAGLTAAAVAPRADLAHRLRLIAGGCAFGIAAAAAFNVFRFGSVFNIAYWEHPYHTPGLGLTARLFAALWFAPNGGILWFWPAAIGMLLLAAGGATAARRQARVRAEWLAGWAVIALLFLQLAGLATWYSPFGWFAWGPRLSLPLVPAILLTSAIVCTRATDTLRRVLHRAWFWVGAAATIVLALPQIGILFRSNAYGTLFAHDRVCRGSHVETDPHGYYRCFEHTAWGKSSALLHGAWGIATVPGAAAAACFVVAVTALLVLARERSHADLPDTADMLEPVAS